MSEQQLTPSHGSGGGFRPCRPDEPGAYVDLSRYADWHDDRERSFDESSLDERRPDPQGR